MNKTLDNLVRYVVYTTEPEEVVLFGSMVNGSADVFSDIDLLVIVENEINKKEAISRIRSYASQFALKTDVLIYSPSELEKEISIPNGFINAIQKTGKIVFKNSGKIV
ncbi:MAG TPA: nucleotidyltransferase domain-containing protein [Lunatimonas sp.]|nr:nucleotidyltransferase domain-containing protein [Lunatimonas sp.]